jgi:hypothetical protein
MTPTKTVLQHKGFVGTHDGVACAPVFTESALHKKLDDSGRQPRAK